MCLTHARCLCSYIASLPSFDSPAASARCQYACSCHSLVRGVCLEDEDEMTELADPAVCAVLGGVSLPNISMLSANLWTDHSTALSLAYLTLSLSINVVLTITIACRLLKLRNTFPNFLDDRSGCLYTYIVTMFVESASLYSIVAIVTIVACGINSPIQNALLPMLGQLQVRDFIQCTYGSTLIGVDRLFHLW